MPEEKPANDNLRNLLGVTDFGDGPMIWVTDNTIYDPPHHKPWIAELHDNDFFKFIETAAVERCLPLCRLFTQCQWCAGADCHITPSTDF